MTQTNETNCILATDCAHAGSPAKCTDRCPHFAQLHSATGRHTRAGLPAKYALTTLVDAPPRADQPEVYGIIDHYVTTFVRQFDAEPAIKSLYLFSAEPGTGKTTTAAGLINAYLTAHYVGSLKRGSTPKERPVFFLDVNEWQTYYNTLTRPGVPDWRKEEAADVYYAWLDRAKAADFAVLDDIGVRGASEAFRGDLHDIINARVAAEKPTVYTSNIPLADLASLYDARLTDRVRDQCLEAPFKGQSKRGRR